MATNNKAIAKKLFDTFPAETEVHFTSDGSNFFNKHNAELHARSLKDKDVDSIKKYETAKAADDAVNEDEEADSTPAAAKANKPKK